MSFHPPPPYSTYIPSAEPALDLSFGVSIFKSYLPTPLLILLQSYLHHLILLQPPWYPIHALPLLYRTQIPMKTTFWKRHPCLMKWTCSTSFHILPSGSMNASAYLDNDYANWYDFSSTVHVSSSRHSLQVDLGTSNGLHVPHDVILSSLHLISWSELANIAECQNLVSVCLPMIVESSLFPRVKVPT